ncbi:MAG: hypothetical protein ABGX83_09440 [Nitrospira sp.]|nr:hypothetical protein [Candidatus Manganitrophaceae bacterium]HIL34097.1 hypothetical protein [Candidatus Manganitrophaceae bacterium]
MKRLMVYSHDRSGYGNIQRMLNICESLIQSDPDLSVLVVSGSPLMQSFRIPQRLDYIKLPSLRLAEPCGGGFSVAGKKDQGNVHLQTDLMLSAVNHYRPDVFLVDKSPYGEANELKEVLDHIKVRLPETKPVLLLGDIVDSPETTSRIWEATLSHYAIRAFYDLVLLTGSPEMFEASCNYVFPGPVCGKVRFCLDLCAFSQITHYVSSMLLGYSVGDERGGYPASGGLFSRDLPKQVPSRLVYT